MKTGKVFKLIITSVCFGVALGLTGNITCLWATTDTGELGMGEEAQDVKSSSGVLDYIDKERVVINDFPFPIVENTHFRTIGGGVTTSDHFSEGDAVSFVTDPEETVLIELQMRESATEKQTETSKTMDSNGPLQLKEGVWTN